MGNSLALETIYGGPSSFTVVISRALVGLELLSVTIDSTSPGGVAVRIEPERSVHFSKCFPMITSIVASRLFAKVKPPKGCPGEEMEGGQETWDPADDPGQVRSSSQRPWWHGWKVLPQQDAEEERKMSLLFDLLSLPGSLTDSLSVPFASLRCTESSSENGPREYLVSLGWWVTTQTMGLKLDGSHRYYSVAAMLLKLLLW